MEFVFDCKVRKLSARTIDNYQKMIGYLTRFIEDEYGIVCCVEVYARRILAPFSAGDRFSCSHVHGLLSFALCIYYNKFFLFLNKER